MSRFFFWDYNENDSRRLSASIGSIKNNYSLRRYRFSTDITDWYLPTIFFMESPNLGKSSLIMNIIWIVIKDC